MLVKNGPKLSLQELRIAKLTTLGHTGKQIQDLLDIRAETLKTHITAISCKTGLGRKQFWMLFTEQYKHHIPSKFPTLNTSEATMPFGVLEIDSVVLSIQFEVKRIDLGVSKDDND